MLAIQFLILGLIQGLTETIPVSSSGHLMIIKRLLNANINYDAIAIMTNFGSLVAIIVLFWPDIKKIFLDFFRFLTTKDANSKENYEYAWMIALGCIPAGIMGLIISKLDLFVKIENNIKIVGISLIITALLLFIVRNFKGKKDYTQLNFKEALVVGCFQILGLFPGISRSGSTIVGGMVAGLKRETAFNYSFMLYIPLSLAAMALELTDITISNALIPFYLFAALIAGIATYIVTKWFRKIVIKGKLVYFSIYCLIVGILVLIFLK